MMFEENWKLWVEQMIHNKKRKDKMPLYKTASPQNMADRDQAAIEKTSGHSQSQRVDSQVS